MWVLVTASAALGIATCFATRMAVLRGAAGWEAERTERRGDLPAGAPGDWKRMLLAVTGQVFAWLYRTGAIDGYRQHLLRDSTAAGFPWDLDEQEILELSELAFVAATLLTWLVMLVAYGSFNLF